MRSILLIIWGIIVASSAYGQKTDSAKKEPGNLLEAKYNKCIQTADEYFKNHNYVNAKTNYENALKLKPEEKYPKDKIEELDKLLAKSDSTKTNTIKIKEQEFTFVGKWQGIEKNDTLTLVFKSDSNFEIIHQKAQSKAVYGKWKTSGDSMDIISKDFEEIEEGEISEAMKDHWLKFKILNNDEAIFYFPKFPQGTIFRKL